MEYLFVYADNGWWLKLDTIEGLIDYHQKTDGSRYENAMEMYLHKELPENNLEKLPLEERVQMMCSRDFKYLQAAVMQAEKGNGTIIDGFRWLNMEIGMSQLRIIQQYGAVFINPVGGHTFDVKYDQFCRRKELVFPDFKKSDIRIKRYQEGTHFYAFIGDMQVRDGESLKWNTREQAYQKALTVIK